jgi:hypothetical protein
MQDAIKAMDQVDMGGRPVRVSIAERPRPDLPARVRATSPRRAAPR